MNNISVLREKFGLPCRAVARHGKVRSMSVKTCDRTRHVVPAPERTGDCVRVCMN